MKITVSNDEVPSLVVGEKIAIFPEKAFRRQNLYRSVKRRRRLPSDMQVV